MAKKRTIKLTHVEFDTQEDQLKFVKFLRLLMKLSIKIKYDAAMAAAVKPLKSKGNKLVSDMVFMVLIWYGD